MKGITFDVGGSKYHLDESDLKTEQGRAKINKVLELRIQEIRADPTHPYNNRNDAGHAAAVAEMNAAYRFRGGEMPQQEIAEMVTKLTGGGAQAAPAAPYQQIAELMSKPEMRVALQRSRTGQPLDAT